MILISTKYYESCLLTFPLSFLDPSPLCNVVHIDKMLLVNKNENIDAVFAFVSKHNSKARNRNLVFKSAR